MDLVRYANAAEFRARTEPLLLGREAEHNLILGILAGIASGREWVDPPPYLALALAGSDPVLAAIMTPPHNLLLSHTESLEALPLLVEDLLRSGYGVPGVTGSPVVSEAFAGLWQEKTGHKARLAMGQRIYELEKVRWPVDVPGHLRRATEADRPLLREWFTGFFHDADPGGDPEKSVDRFLTTQSRGLYLWEDGEPVSMAGHIAATPHGDRVGAVYTPPEWRRRGYASACVAALSRMLLDQGRRFCFLYTDLANPTSNHIYQEIGYRAIADSVMLCFEEPAQGR